MNIFVLCANYYVGDYMEFKDRLKKLRKINGMTQEELSKKSGLAIGTIRQYEAGKRRPEYEALMKILKAFDLTDAELLRGLQSSTSSTDIKKEPALESGLDELDIQLLAIIRTLSADQKQFLLAQLQTLQANQGGK